MTLKEGSGGDLEYKFNFTFNKLLHGENMIYIRKTALCRVKFEHYDYSSVEEVGIKIRTSIVGLCFHDNVKMDN